MGKPVLRNAAYAAGPAAHLDPRPVRPAAPRPCAPEGDQAARGWRTPERRTPERAASEAATSERVTPGRRRARRIRLTVTALACTLACIFAQTPATADPGNTVPDSGARPAPLGSLVMPGQGGGVYQTGPGTSGYQTTPVGLSPIAAQIVAQEREVGRLGEQVLRAEQNLTEAVAAVSRAEDAWRSANERLNNLRARSDSASADAYKRATELGPFDEYAWQLHQLSKVAPGLGNQLGEQAAGEAAARDLLRAEEECRAAYRVYQELSTTARNATTERDNLKATFMQRQAALTDLRNRNRQVEAERDAYEQSLGTGPLGVVNADGMTAAPQAIQAMQYALAQRGKPYVWGTQGPSTFDCSGLVWAAYRSVGRTLPRIANEQYRGTTAIKSSRSVKGDLLVPGDLLFFSTSPSDWTQIHHVGMYIGSGLMVHAPTSGDVVKVAPVWWSEFFGATRVFDAVPAPTPSPTPQPTPTPEPSESESHPSSPSSSHSPSPSKSHSKSPSSSATSSPTGSPSTTPAPAKGQTATGTG